MKFNFCLFGSLLASSAAFHQVQPLSRAFVQNRAGFAPLLAAYVDIDESTGRDIGSMEEWAANCGVQRAEGFQLASEDGNDWSAMTSVDMPTGSPILAVPAGMILSTQSAREELGEGLQAAADKLSMLGAADQVPEFYLIMKILYEYEQGDESPFFPWLNSMPRLFFNSISMTEFCLECLPPLVFSLSRNEKRKFTNFCDVLDKVDIISPTTKINKPLLEWAFNVVHTRSIGTPDNKIVVPLGDMFNHGTETQVDLSFDEEGNCNVYTTTDVPAGSPLHTSYGCSTNPSALFATYGFLDETSPATFCKIMNIKENEELKELGLDFSRMVFYTESGGVSQEVWDVLTYDVLKNNREYQQAFYEAHVNGDVETKQQIQQSVFLETTTALQTHIDTFLKQLDGLAEKSVGKDINEHPRLPLILAHNDFVKNTFLLVKSQIDPMVAQAAGV